MTQLGTKILNKYILTLFYIPKETKLTGFFFILFKINIHFSSGWGINSTKVPILIINVQVNKNNYIS